MYIFLCMVAKSIFIIKTNYLVLFMEISLIEIYSMNRIKHICSTCVENAEFSDVTIGGIYIYHCA